MKKSTLWLCLLLCLLPVRVCAEDLQRSARELIATLELGGLGDAVEQSELLNGSAEELLARLCGGQTLLSAGDVFAWMARKASGILAGSVWRMTRLLAPALLTACAQWIRTGDGQAGKAARYAGLLMTLMWLTADLREHVALCVETISRMTGAMQAVFPLMVTLLAAVGGSASSAFYQPAVMAAAGSMTTLIQHITMPLCVCVAVLTMVSGVSEGLRVSRLCALFRQAANWTLGFGFTVFIGVMTVEGVGAAAVDGVSIRTAKYAMDHFIPIVGGMFADTVDTLVGCSLVVLHAVGTLGLTLLLGMLLLPLLRTVMTMFLYRAAAAFLQPVDEGPLCRAIGGYADVFSLMFIIQLSVGAMFLLLAAQLIVVGQMTVMLR